MKGREAATNYDVLEGSIADSTTNQELSFTDIGVALDTKINNDGVGSISVRFNKTTNKAYTIKAGESPIFNDFEINKIFLSNSSGGSISYRIIALGYPAGEQG